MTRLEFSVRVRLLPTELGGKKGPIMSDYRPSWNLGNTWLGEPLAPEFWGGVRVGSVIAMQEGNHVVGHATVLSVASRPENSGTSPTSREAGSP